MKTITMFTNCITYEQLQNYSLNKGDKTERAQIYKHISTCELCACAVNGFAAIPFTSADVEAIHNQIDVKTNATHANPLTFAHVMIVVVSLMSIFGFYKMADSISKNEKEPLAAAEKMQPLLIRMPKSEPSFFVKENRTIVSNKIPKQNKIVENKLVKNNVIPVEAIESIKPGLIDPVAKKDDVVLESTYNSDIIYIYDLKVTDYNNLYFIHNPRHIYWGNYTPSFKENRNNSTNLIDKDAEQIVPADRVLKRGLEYFNKGKYNDAIAQFQMLIDINAEDVNALFYSALACYQIGKYNAALKNLDAVLKNANNAFHPEAKWNLALINIKIGNKQLAKQLLAEIVNEKGFYSKKAENKLKGL